MAKYRRKVTEVEAVEFVGTNHDELHDFAGDAVRFIEGSRQLHVVTPSGPVPLENGDYVAQNPKDATDFYPIKAAQFADLYEPIKDSVTA